MLFQLLILIVVTFSTFYLVGLAFSVSYSTINFFNLSYAVDIVYAAYLFKTFSFHFKITPLLAILLAILFCVIFQLSTYRFIYSKLKGENGFFKLITAIGVLVIMQNILSILYGDSTILNSSSLNENFSIGNVVITSNQITLFLSALVVFIAHFYFFKFTPLGKKIKATSANKNLSMIFGIKTDRIEMVSILISSIVFSLAGILYSFYTVLNPMYGFDLLLYGIIAMIIGGINSNWGLVCGAFLLASAQHLGAYYIDSKWVDAIAYLVLISFLIWKPLGFSGKRLKKVEI